MGQHRAGSAQRAMNYLEMNHSEQAALRVLSIQADILGNRTYCESMRKHFAQTEYLDMTAHWYHDCRTLADWKICKLTNLAVAMMSNGVDLWGARHVWSLGRMGTRVARRNLAERRYDILHFHTQVLGFGAAELMRRIPTVVSCDTTAYHEARDSTVRHPATRPNVAMEQKVFHAAAHIVTWSEWARRSVIAEHGIAEGKVTAILPGARLDTFADPTFAPHSRLRILFVGGDFTRKGGWDLLEVFTQHLADRAELHLVTQHPVERSAPNVFIHQGISAYSPQWHEQFRNADVFVMPTYSDCMPLVFQEAAGYGLALLGTSIGAIPEMIFPGENGFLIEPGDRDALAERLRAFADDRGELLRMRRRSREIALEKFDAAKNFRQLADLFRIVSGAPRAGG